MFHRRLAFLVQQAIQFPSDVVVGIHHASNNVEYEEEQENEPVWKVVEMVASYVGLYEDRKCDNPGDL